MLVDRSVPPPLWAGLGVVLRQVPLRIRPRAPAVAAHLAELLLPSTEVLLELQKEGKIRHLEPSKWSLGQLELAITQTEIVTVSNAYSVTDRSDDAVVDRCTEHAIPYLPYFPLAIGKVAGHSALVQAAEQLGATPAQVALAWLLSRSHVMLPIPGTCSLQHLEENVAAAGISLPPEMLS